MNEDFKIMTVSFSDINDKQFTEQLKERLYNHCIRYYVHTNVFIINVSFNFLTFIPRMEEINEEKKQKTEILAIKEFLIMIESKICMIEQRHNIREIKNIMKYPGEIKKGETEKFEETGQPAAST